MFLDIREEIPTGLGANVDGRSADIVFVESKNFDLYDVYIRLYSEMNHNNTKRQKEFFIGREARCSFLSFVKKTDSILAVCGSVIYVQSIAYSPTVTLSGFTRYPSGKISLNGFVVGTEEGKSVPILFRNTDNDSGIATIYVLLIYLCIIVLLSIAVFLIIGLIVAEKHPKQKEEKKQKQVAKRLKDLREGKRWFLINLGTKENSMNMDRLLGLREDILTNTEVINERIWKRYAVNDSLWEVTEESWESTMYENSTKRDNYFLSTIDKYSEFTTTSKKDD